MRGTKKTGLLLNFDLDPFFRNEEATIPISRLSLLVSSYEVITLYSYKQANIKNRQNKAQKKDTKSILSLKEKYFPITEKLSAQSHYFFSDCVVANISN